MKKKTSRKPKKLTAQQAQIILFGEGLIGLMLDIHKVSATKNNPGPPPISILLQAVSVVIENRAREAAK